MGRKKLNESDPTSIPERIALLKEFIDTHGRFPKMNDNSKLYTWITSLRGAYKRNDLDEELISELNKIGMIWSISENSWNRHYETVKEILNTEGTSAAIRKNNVTSKWFLDNIRYKDRLDGEEKTQKIDELLALLYEKTGEKEYKRPNQRTNPPLKVRKSRG